MVAPHSTRLRDHLLDPAPWLVFHLTVAGRPARLAGLLRQSGLTLVGGTALFQLASHPEAAKLYEHLGRRGILVRAFDGQPDWLRFGLPAARDAGRLETALAAFAP